MTTACSLRRIGIGIVTLCLVCNGLAPFYFPLALAQSGPPQITAVSIKNNTLSVKGRNFTGAAKVEIDGRALADSKSDTTGSKLKSKQGGALSAGSYIVTVRNGDNQRSAPAIFDFQTTQTPKVSLSLTAASLRLPVGATLQLAVSAKDAAGGELTGVSYSWQSANGSVASVDQSGLVRGLQSGTSRITVSALRNQTAVDVTIEGGAPGPAASVSVVPSTPVLNENGSLQLKAEVRDANGQVLSNVPGTWSSDNEALVTVDANGGLAKAVRRGFAAVTVRAGNVQDTVSIAVVKVEKGNPDAFVGPGEVRVDLANRVYQTDLARQVVLRGEFGKPLQLYSGATGVKGMADGKLLEARYNGPLGIGVDNQGGQVFIADTANQVVRMLRPDGQVGTLAGVAGQSGYRDGPVAQALFNSPRGSAVAGDGNVYVADSNNQVIRKIDMRTMMVSTLAGKPGATGATDGSGANAQFNQPQSLALDSQNRSLVVADTGNGRVRLVSLDGQVTTVGVLGNNRKVGAKSGSKGLTVAPQADAFTFTAPQSVSVDGIGTIYVSDATGVKVIPRPGGKVQSPIELAENASLGSVSGVAVTTIEGTFAGGTKANAVLVNSQTGAGNQLLRVTVGVPFINRLSQDSAFLGEETEITATGVNFTPDVQLVLDGIPVKDFKFVKSTELRFKIPAAAESGLRTLTILGRGGSRQRPFFIQPVPVAALSQNQITTLAGGTTYIGDGGDSGNCSLAGPGGLAVDSDGNLLLADRFNHRLRRVDAETNLITTVAGRGTAGSEGDGNLAVSALLNLPEGVALDADGNMYVSDAGNARIRRIDAKNQTITTIAGGSQGFGGDNGPALQAKLNGPAGLAFDRDGNLFVADADNHRVRRIDAKTRVITTVAGTGEAGFSGDGGAAAAARLNHPTDVAIDRLGNLFVADENNQRIRRISEHGTISTVIGTGTAGGSGLVTSGKIAPTALTLNFPHSVEFHPFGFLLVADTWNHCVRAVEYNFNTGELGNASTFAGQDNSPGFAGDGRTATDGLLQRPTHIAVDGAGNLFISDSLNNRIRRVSGATLVLGTFVGTGSLDYLADGSPANQSRLITPQGITLDGNRNLFICEPEVGRVRRMDPTTGALFAFAGKFDLDVNGDNGESVPALQASLARPGYAAADSLGNLFITDEAKGVIYQVGSLSGSLQVVAGNPNGSLENGVPALNARLVAPRGCAIGPDGNLYFADSGTHRIRRLVMSSGVIETVVGSGNTGFAGDGGPASAARLSSPTNLAFDKNGNLLIADTGNHRIRRATADLSNRNLLAFTEIVTVAGNGQAGFNGDGAAPTAASLNAPTAVAVDGDGRLVIADRDNNRVRLVDGNVVTTLAGNGQSGAAADGVRAAQSALNRPVDVTIDSDGNLLVSEQGSSRVRLVRSVLTPVRK
ncbi:MAG: SMP-30/gluconolactonase/LRE family protein [Blastocatellia bacterium]|nr:SMP-30/gluconolactonase/LRE family protein [Blastocatellia bacterium]